MTSGDLLAKTMFIMGANTASEAWRTIRSHRAAPSERLAQRLSGQRKKVFHMALDQAQQQLSASAAIGYESRPLNLFYGITQAGRALSAASKDLGYFNAPPERRTWLGTQHGLQFPTTLSSELGLFKTLGYISLQVPDASLLTPRPSSHLVAAKLYRRHQIIGSAPGLVDVLTVRIRSRWKDVYRGKALSERVP